MNEATEEIVVTTISNRAIAPHVDILLGAIDFEIARIDAEQKRPGWTNWALVGCLATILWLLLNEAEAQKIAVLNVMVPIIGMSLTLSCVELLLSLLAANESRHKGTYRFSLTPQALGVLRPKILFNTIWAGVLLWSVSRTSTVWPNLPARFAKCAFVLQFLLNIMTLIFSYIEIPLPMTKRTLSNRCLLAFLLVVFLYPAWAYLTMGIFTPKTVSVADYRTAGLITAIIFIISLLLNYSYTPLSGALIQMRRQLTEGNADPTAIARQLDVAIAGMRVDDFVQEDLRLHLTLTEQFEVNDKAFVDKISILKERFASDAFAREDQKEKVVIKILLESCKQSCDRRKGLIDCIKKQHDRIMKRLKLIIKIAGKEAAAACNEVLDKIEQALSQLTERLNITDKAFLELQQQVEHKRQLDTTLPMREPIATGSSPNERTRKNGHH